MRGGGRGIQWPASGRKLEVLVLDPPQLPLEKTICQSKIPPPPSWIFLQNCQNSTFLPDQFGAIKLTGVLILERDRERERERVFDNAVKHALCIYDRVHHTYIIPYSYNVKAACHQF